ncbi:MULTISPECIES: hypothetical protein [Streptomyces]|uniref:hypothetical protein n=1 Tax=Streptomyces TaxID=1883 RepID=UPI002271934B|nr:MULTISPECIES: hypothetical protein [unclassified Streptomyces]MCY0940236.1 hypothetical protein [Streptomyces sp. H34-AA3]MCZ4080883.1 hypothetical protein [Streptomyces sp. H34-S5]
MDRVFDDVPKAEELRRGDDVTPDLHTVVGDIGVILAEICEELTTSSRHEFENLTGYSHAERFGTAALAQCAPPLGTALAHLSQVVDRLGFLHENIRHSSTERTPPPGDVRVVIQDHLDQASTALRTAAQQLRGKATEITRVFPTRTAAMLARYAPAAVPPAVIPTPGRNR